MLIIKSLCHLLTSQKYVIVSFILINFYCLGSELKFHEAQNVVYGGVLNETKSKPCTSINDMKRIAKFALQEASKTSFEASKLTNESYMQIYSLSDCSVMEMYYTRDGKTRTTFQTLDPVTGYPVELPIYWGELYRFKINVQESDHIHSFTVTEYIDGELYLFEHTVYRSTEVDIPKEPIVSTKTRCEEQSDPVKNQLSIESEESSSYSLYTSFQQILSRFDQCSLDNNNNLQQREASKYLTPKSEVNHPSLLSVDGVTRTFSQWYNQTQEFTILTFNVWNTNTVKRDSNKGTLYKQRIKHIVKVCEGADADVIAFQEVRFEDGKGGSWGPNQVKHLSRLLKKYQYVFQPAQIQEHGLPYRIEEGVAIFSKHPISHTDYLLLSRNRRDVADTHQRILLHARINIPQFGPINVFNTHLSLSHVARQRTVREIWDHIKQFSEPVFLTGDFNAEAHNDEIRFLAGEVALKGLKTSGLVDTWKLKYGDQDKGFTFNTLEEDLTKRIDLIFMRKHPHINFLDIEKVDDGLRKEFAASDHIGLLATFQGKRSISRE